MLVAWLLCWPAGGNSWGLVGWLASSYGHKLVGWAGLAGCCLGGCQAGGWLADW